MRLEHLRVTAVGPFAGTEEIDFAALTSGGLFLLEGPTGAGKSTVLDAITFALFGQPAGEGTSADRLRSHFAPPDTTPEVELTFSVRGQRLRITRVPEHKRPKKRGDGSTLEKARVRLESHDATRWVLVSSNIAEVGDEIEHRLRLNRAQFTKVVLLPQGEFATFLRAKDDVRRGVLTQIFGTAFYDRVTRQLEDWRRDAKHERDLADEEVTKAVAALGAAAGLDADARAVLEAAVSDADDDVLVELETGLAAAVDEATAVLATATAARDTALARRDELASAHAAHTDLAAVLLRQAAHSAAADDHAARARELQEARAAAPVAVVLRQLDDARDRLADRRRELVAMRADLTGDETLDDATGLEEESRTWDATAAGLKPVALVEAALGQRRAAATAYDEQIDAFEQTLKQLEVRRVELPGLIADLEAEVERLAALAATLPSRRAAHAEAQKRLNAATSLVTIQRELDAAVVALTEAERLHLDAKAHRLALFEKHLAGMAAELASHLDDGVPCPVCGGTDHPALATLGDGHVAREEVDEAERIEARAAAVLGSATTALASTETRRATLAAQADGYDVETAAVQLEAVTSDLDLASDAAEALEPTRARLVELRTESDTTERQQSEALQQLARLTTARTQALEEVRRDENEVTLALEEFDSVADRIEALHARAHAARDAAAALRDLAAARDSVASHEREVALVAEGAGFPDPDLARAAVRPAAAIAALEAAVSDWENESSVLAELAADPRFTGLDPALAVPVAQALAEAEQNLSASGAAVAQQQGELARREQRLTGFREHRVRLDERRAARAATYADTAAVHRIAGLANGSSGSPRMSLTTYVLRRSFRDVVEAANRRLDRMSAGRYQLLRTDETERKVDQAGLGLLVVDRHTGEERSPRSLSGGETFYTSLALALGLADVVRAEAGGVELDTLFIDEGFGSLDAETLDLVMAVIDDLRDGGRAIGIVSHVTDLKDQITERLEIRRTDPQGPSTTRVVA